MRPNVPWQCRGLQRTALLWIALFAAACQASPGSGVAPSSATTAGADRATLAAPAAGTTGEPAPIARGAATVSFCAQAGSAAVVCSLPDSAEVQDLSTLLASAQALNSSVSSSTPMVIAAFGGNGGGKGGEPGEAQTVTTVTDYKSTYGTTDLYYYLGDDGGESAKGYTGGASTLVASVSLKSTEPCITGFSSTESGSCSASNILLVAGGGGGKGSPGLGCHGGTGGDGGKAVVTGSDAATGGGSDGEGMYYAGCSGGHAGQGGAKGKGGDGGDGGGGQDAHAGLSGQDGIGGAGGPQHTGSGPGPSVYWTNTGSDSTLDKIGSYGAGGEGEWRGVSTAATPGGSGGGGYGGGGAGGSGGVDFPGAGGGGGGSYATGATTTVPSYTATNTTGGAVVIVAFLLQ